MEELAVGTGADLINGLVKSQPVFLLPFHLSLHFPSLSKYTYRRIEIDEDGARDIFAVARLGEERLKRATLGNSAIFRVDATVGFEAMLEQVSILSTEEI